MKSNKIKYLAVLLAASSLSTPGIAQSSESNHVDSDISGSEEHPFQNIIQALRQAGINTISENGVITIDLQYLNSVFEAAKEDGFVVELAGQDQPTTMNIRLLENLNPSSPLVDPTEILLREVTGSVKKALIQNGSTPVDQIPD